MSTNCIAMCLETGGGMRRGVGAGGGVGEVDEGGLVGELMKNSPR